MFYLIFSCFPLQTIRGYTQWLKSHVLRNIGYIALAAKPAS